MGMQRATIDFVVDTVGHCFICMDEIPVPPLFPQTESGMESSTPLNHSMRSFARFINLKMRKAFQQEDLIPENLLRKVEKSTLKVSLCEECASWNVKISELLQQLEKIEIEAASYVQLIHDKLKRADESGKSYLFGKLVDQSSGLMGKLQIAEALRKETADKCSQKIYIIKPKIKLKNVAQREVFLANDKLRHTSWNSGLKLHQTISPNSNSADLPILETTTNDVKHEPGPLEETLSYIDNDYLDGLEDSSMDFERQCSSPKTDNTFQVDLPVKITTSKLKQHKYTRNPDTRKLKCNLCSKEFASTSTANIHYRSVHLNVRFKCNICDKVFTNKANLTVHQKSAHLKQRFDCQFCQMSFSTNGHRRRHIRTNKHCNLKRRGTSL